VLLFSLPLLLLLLPLVLSLSERVKTLPPPGREGHHEQASPGLDVPGHCFRAHLHLAGDHGQVLSVICFCKEE